MKSSRPAALATAREIARNLEDRGTARRGPAVTWGSLAHERYAEMVAAMPGVREATGEPSSPRAAARMAGWLDPSKA